MAYWLIKSEPFTYAWDQFVADSSTFWDGVVGIAKVIKESYQDPTTDETAWVVVDFKPHKKLKKTVTLAAIKATPSLANMALIRLGRLSVQPVLEEEWEIIMAMSEEK